MNEAWTDTAASAAAGRSAETIANRAVNAVVDYSKKKFGEAQVSLGTAFTRYLENAKLRYNKIKTIATGIQPRLIIRDKNKPQDIPLYVQIGVSYRRKECSTQSKEYSTQSIEKLLPIGKHLLIEGTGGAGKSMLMRYLFLDTAYREEYVPILLGLRRLGELDRLGKLSGGIVSLETIFELVYSQMKDFNVRLDSGQFEYSLESGKYLFLFDGFDEIPGHLAGAAAHALQRFCSKYPENVSVVTSRPREYMAPLETFSVLEIMPMRKGQAVLLASKLWDENEKTREFCAQLDKELFDKHKDFAENPLLLTMMFLTFMRNGSIPDHLCDFYQKAYEALYSAHDNQDKGVFKREFQCKTLDEKTFSSLFAYFCFQSYFKEDYEFTEDQLLGYLDRGIEKLGLVDVKAQDYLKDLQNIVCMIVREGYQYKFSHRSFQTYFAACYTCGMTDDVQKRWFNTIFEHDSFRRRDYFSLMYQLEPERFTANALADGLRAFQFNVDASSDPNVFFLRRVFCGIRLYENKKRFLILYSSNPDAERFSLVLGIISKRSAVQADDREIQKQKLFEIIRDYLAEFCANTKNYLHDFSDFRYIEVNGLSKEKFTAFCHAIIDYCNIESIRASLRQWLDEQDEKRKKLEASSDLSDLLDAL